LSLQTAPAWRTNVQGPYLICPCDGQPWLRIVTARIAVDDARRLVFRGLAFKRTVRVQGSKPRALRLHDVGELDGVKSGPGVDLSCFQLAFSAASAAFARSAP